MTGRGWLWLLLGLALWGGGAAVTLIPPRGIRNKNPGNLRRTRDAWEGLAAEQTDPEYFQFVDPVYGLRAQGIVLLNYFSRHGLNTVRKIVARYAPAHENPTDKYVENVARWLNVSPDEPIDVPARLRELMRAIVMQEQGHNAAVLHVPASLYDEALMLIAKRNA